MESKNWFVAHGTHAANFQPLKQAPDGGWKQKQSTCRMRLKWAADSQRLVLRELFAETTSVSNGLQIHVKITI